MGRVSQAAFENNRERYIKKIEEAFRDVEFLLEAVLSTVKDEGGWAEVKACLDRQSDIRRRIVTVMGERIGERFAPAPKGWIDRKGRFLSCGMETPKNHDWVAGHFGLVGDTAFALGWARMGAGSFEFTTAPSQRQIDALAVWGETYMADGARRAMKQIDYLLRGLRLIV